MSFPVDIYKWGLATNNSLSGVNAAGSGIDITGATNVATGLYNLLYLTKNVFLPPGLYDVTGADGFKPPSGCRLTGVRPTFTMDGAGGGTFSAGSVLTGSGPSVLNVGNRSGLDFSNFGINATGVTGNAIQGLGNTTSNLVFDGIVTNAANHNYLFEQFGSDPQGAAGGGITIRNFELHGGPNGIAIKTANVLVSNGIAHDISVQCYVAVSDNIEGASIYNRAQNVTFENCQVGLRCGQYGGRVYSRDCWSITNANGVQPVKNVRFVGGNYSGAGRHSIMIGDEVALETTPLSGSPAAGQTRLLSESIDINTKFGDSGWNGLRVASGKGVRARGTTGGNGTAGTVGGTTYTNVNIAADTAGALQQGGAAVVDFQISSDLFVYGTAAGLETQIATILQTASTFSVAGRAQVYKTVNTDQRFITAVTGASVGQEFTVWLSENFSVVNMSGGTEFRGAGQFIKYRCIDSAGTLQLVGATDANAQNEVPRTFAAAFNANFSGGLRAISVAMTGDMTAIGIFAPPSTVPRDGYSLRLQAGAATRALAGWTTAFKFPIAQFPSGAPTSVVANTTLLITFFWDGAYMVAKGSWVY
jgi:hypothetical protein